MLVTCEITVCGPSERPLWRYDTFGLVDAAADNIFFYYDMINLFRQMQNLSLNVQTFCYVTIGAPYKSAHARMNRKLSRSGTWTK